MPQELNDDWKYDLGDQWNEIHDRYLHTIGNLTLTGYNPSLGNNAFKKKCKIYEDSVIAITTPLGAYAKWGEDEIQNRTDYLAKKAVNIWKYPAESISANDYDMGDDETLNQQLEDEHLDGKNTLDLWMYLKEEILKAFHGVVFQMNKHYASFKIVDSGMVICTMLSLNNSVRIHYNTKIDDGIVMPSNFVTDVSKVGHLGLGDLQTTIASIDDVSRVIYIIELVWRSKRTLTDKIP